MKLLKVEATVSFENPKETNSKSMPELDISAAHLIYDFLAHNCYSASATAFLSQWQSGANPVNNNNNNNNNTVEALPNNRRNDQVLTEKERLLNCTLEYRTQVKGLILAGRIGESILYLEEFFPQLFTPSSQTMSDGHLIAKNGELRFYLLCQQFVEMIRQGDATGALEFTETHLTPLAQTSGDLLTHLQDVVVLLAYADPMESPVRHLLDLSHRQKLAHRVNAAILRKSS